MPRQVDQLPPDATSLARRVRNLERALDELRASRRAAYTTVSGGAIMVVRPGETVPAAIMASDLGDGQAGFQTNAGATYSRLESGRLVFGAEDLEQAEPTGISGSATGGVLDLMSGMVGTNTAQAHIMLASGDSGFTSDGSAYIYLGWDGAGPDMEVDVSGILMPRNMAWQRVTVNITTANTAASTTVTGLTVRGSTFQCFTSPLGSALPVGTTTSASSITSNSVIVWANRSTTGSQQVAYLITGSK